MLYFPFWLNISCFRFRWLSVESEFSVKQICLAVILKGFAFLNKLYIKITQDIAYYLMRCTNSLRFLSVCSSHWKLKVKFSMRYSIPCTFLCCVLQILGNAVGHHYSVYTKVSMLWLINILPHLSCGKNTAAHSFNWLAALIEIRGDSKGVHYYKKFIICHIHLNQRQFNDLYHWLNLKNLWDFSFMHVSEDKNKYTYYTFVNMLVFCV